MTAIQRLNADNERAGQALKEAHARTQALQQQRQLEEEAAWLMQERRQQLIDMGINPDAEGNDG